MTETTTPTFQIGQWVRSRPVGGIPTFNGEIIERHDDSYVIRDSMKRRFWRGPEQLEPLQ